MVLTALMFTTTLEPAFLQLVAAAAAALVLVGFWTPVAGVLLAVAELCLAFSHASDPSIHLLLSALGAALAMLGPGAWSVDARLFGWKRIDVRDGRS